MKLFTAIIFLLISLYAYPQEPIQSNDIPELVKRNNICEQLSFGKEAASKKYLSRKIVYDSSGRSLLQIDFNWDSSINSTIASYYFGDTLEMDVYTEQSNIDTAKYIYKNGVLTAEYWYWSEDKKWSDSAFYFYNSANKLIFKTDIYLARKFDSLKYADNKLIQEIQYDELNVKQKEINYTYAGNLLISKTEYHKYLEGDSTYYSYNKKNKVKLKKGTNYNTAYYYYKNGFLKKRYTKLITKQGAADLTKIRYNKTGFITKIKSYLNGKRTSLHKTRYIKCNAL